MFITGNHPNLSEDQKRGIALIELLLSNAVLLHKLNEALVKVDTEISAAAVCKFVYDICSRYGDGQQLLSDITQFAAEFGMDIKVVSIPADNGSVN